MVDLSHVGINNVAEIYQNLSTGALYEASIRRGEAHVAHLGPLVVGTGKYTGRSPNDKFIVEEPGSIDDIWWGDVNRPFSIDDFRRVLFGLQSYLQGRDVFVQDCYAGADPDYRINVRVITETAWHSLFARNMFIREFDSDVLANFEPDWTVLQCPGFHADPEHLSTNSEAFIL
ncbi:phosphoenolpyruvate carboxykinase (ATP), partial [bacterium]|nr:phosphoenolpyruvate carboxykinase (ATP) [bacterium]